MVRDRRKFSALLIDGLGHELAGDVSHHSPLEGKNTVGIVHFPNLTLLQLKNCSTSTVTKRSLFAYKALYINTA